MNETDLRELQTVLDMMSLCTDRLAGIVRRFHDNDTGCDDLRTFVDMEVLRHVNRNLIDGIYEIRDRFRGVERG